MNFNQCNGVTQSLAGASFVQTDSLQTANFFSDDVASQLDLATGNLAIDIGFISAAVGAGAAAASSLIPFGNFGTQAASSVFSEWHDSITIVSDSLPLGTPVSTRFLLNFLGVSICVVSDTSLAGVSAGGGVGLQVGTVLVTGSFIDCAGGNGLLTIDYDAAIGSVIPISGQMNLGAVAGAFTNGNASGFLDASHTARTYVDIVTPGASYVAASGHSYALPEPVPEPSNFIQLSLGLSALSFLRSRCKAASPLR